MTLIVRPTPTGEWNALADAIEPQKNRGKMKHEWIEPQDKTLVADYWLTRRSADSAPGYDLGLPDIRIVCRWNGKDAWVTGERQGLQRMEPILACKHGNNGWRIEGPA